MNKKLIAVFLSVVLCLSVFTCFNSMVTFAAASGTCGSNATYVYDESTNTLTISGTGAIKNYGVTPLNRVPWYDYRETCTTVIIEEGITEIGDRSFYQMAALENVTLPSTLQVIDDYAFSECTSLVQIKLPDNLETIRQYAFSGCTALASITFPDSLTSLGTARLGNVMVGYSFSDCPNLRTVTYGSGLTTTGKYAFYNSGVKTINWNDSITVVDNYSFFGCSLVNIEIPEQITDINIRAFANNFALSTVYVYNSECNYNGIVGEDPFNGSQQSLTFYGHSKSTTQTYAEEKGYNFISIDPCAHENLTENVIVEPTCTAEGEKQIICDDCNTILRTEPVDALGHDFVTFETANMTDVDGHVYDYQSCSRCGEENCEYTHSEWVDGYYIVTSTATCTRPGIETKTCNICGQKSTPAYVSAGGHQIDEYTSFTDSNCTEAGSRTGVCTVCGNEITETIPAKGHTETITESYTTDDGHTYNTCVCSVCGNERSECVHSEWIEGYYTTMQTSEASCTSNGEILYTCTVCKQTKTETIQMTGHAYDEGVVTQEPTCTATGEKTYTCANCGDTRRIPVASLGHDFSEESILKEPTCTEKGTGSIKCSRCTETKTYEIAALGHDISNSADYAVTKEPNCTEEGTESGTCARCNQVVELALPALGHDYDTENAAVVTAPTCTEDGTAQATCNRCGDVSEVAVPALGHNYVFTAITKSNYITNIEYKCTRCNDVVTYSQTVLVPIFIINVNKNTEDVNNGYRLDLNNDGIINARDYAMIKGYKK